MIFANINMTASKHRQSRELITLLIYTGTKISAWKCGGSRVETINCRSTK